MSKVRVVVISLIFCLAFGVHLYAKDKEGTSGSAISASELKLGYVDLNKALNDIEEGKKAKKQLESQIKVKKDKLTVLEEELKSMKADLDKKRLVLSADALKEKEDQFRQKFMDLQQKMGLYQKEVADLEMQLTQDLVKRLRDIVKTIGESEKYTMILETSKDVVLYAPLGSDLTDRVIKIFNAKKGG